MRSKPKQVDIDQLVKKTPVLRGRLAISSSGCLEYVGPKVGAILGNPIVSTLRGKMLLRRYVGLSTFRSVGKRYITMTCGNHRCHFSGHMELTKQKICFYRHSPQRLGLRLRKGDLFAIRHFYAVKRVNSQIIARVFGITEHTVYNIGIGKHKSYSFSLPNSYHPPRELSRLIAKEVSAGRMLVPPMSKSVLAAALADIRRSHLMRRDRELLIRNLQGEAAADLARASGFARQRAYLIRQRALVRVWQTVGPRKWIVDVSKGQIRAWATHPKLKTPPRPASYPKDLY